MNGNEKYIDRKNALRYMGCRDGAPQELLPLIDECESELCREITPRFVYTVKNIDEIGFLLTGEDVKKHLENCDKAVVLAATLGVAVDALIRKYQSYDVTRALIADAEASAAVEKLCDFAEAKIHESISGYFTWRYSPGYGDFPLEEQTELLSIVDAGRKIGLFAGESYMLTPAKSVTAVIGISKDIIAKELSSCVTCTMSESCSFRKEGFRCGF